jgi:hypothetical protein
MQRSQKPFGAAGIAIRKCAQIEIVSGEVVSRSARQSLYFRCLHRRLDHPRDFGCDPILKHENVCDRAVKPIGPQMSAGFRVE